MARMRSIKPEFWTSDNTTECSIPARLLFIGLLNFCDDNGVHPASIKQLKREVFPDDPFSREQMEGLVYELLDNDLIDAFTYDGEEFWFVRNFRKHQKIDKAKAVYKYPVPPDYEARPSRDPKGTTPGPQGDPKGTPPGPEGDDSGTTDRNGMDGSGEESMGGGAGEPVPGAAPPEPVIPAPDDEGFSLSGDPGPQPVRKPPDPLAKFAEFWQACPRKVGRDKAEPAWERARGRVAKARGIPPDEAALWIRERMIAFARSPAVTDQEPRFVPHPATWLNQGRFDDDDAAWQLGGKAPPAKGGRDPSDPRGNRAAADRLIDRLGLRNEGDDTGPPRIAG